MHASEFFKISIGWFELQAKLGNIKSPQRELILKLEVYYTSNLLGPNWIFEFQMRLHHQNCENASKQLNRDNHP